MVLAKTSFCTMPEPPTNFRSKALPRNAFRQSAKNSLAKSHGIWIFMYSSEQWAVDSGGWAAINRGRRPKTQDRAGNISARNNVKSSRKRNLRYGEKKKSGKTAEKHR